MSSSASSCLAGYRALALRPLWGSHSGSSANLKLYASAFAVRSTPVIKHEYHSKQKSTQQPVAGARSLTRPRPLYLQQHVKAQTTAIAHYASHASEPHDEEIPTTPPFVRHMYDLHVRPILTFYSSI